MTTQRVDPSPAKQPRATRVATPGLTTKSTLPMSPAPFRLLARLLRDFTTNALNQVPPAAPVFPLFLTTWKFRAGNELGYR